MSRFVKAAPLEKIRQHRGTFVAVEGQEIALFRRGTEYFAINNVCSHQHFSVLHLGELQDCTVRCPMHGWVYDLRTGNAVSGSGKVVRYNVKVQDEFLLIEIDDG